MNRLALRLAFVTFILSPVLGFAQSYSGSRVNAYGTSLPSQIGNTLATPPPITGQGSSNRIITTAVPFLLISPDSRGAGLGDAGVASSADANSAYWNAGKLATIDKASGGSLSYTPWLGKIVNDMWVAHLAGFYKINHRQTVGASFKYFNYGPVYFKDANNLDLGTFSPRDMAFDITYSQLLTEHFSIGGSLRYIYSNLTGTVATGADAHAGNSVAVDLGVFYSKPLVSRNATISWGAQISNLGNKMSYGSASQANFIPTNLKIGGAYKTELDALNSFTFLLDFNKLMVPSPNYASTQNQRPLLSGVLGSFNDAPGGFKEEIHEITTSAGAEYWYNKTFAARLGYFFEPSDKGNRKYLTSGVGLRYQGFGFDVAYLVPTNGRESPLAETIRFSILYHFEAKVKESEGLSD